MIPFRGVLCKPHLHIGSFFKVDAFDKANLAGLLSKDDGRSSGAFAEEAHALEQSPVGNSGGGEDQLLAGARSSAS